MVLFYELLDSVRGYLLDGDLLFYRLYLGLRLFGGRTFVHEFRIVKGRTSFEAKMESGKANSFKSPAEAEHESWLAREMAQRIAGHADSRTTKLYVPPRTEGACRRYG